MTTWQLGDWTVTRIADPGFELILPSDTAALQRSPWLQPDYVTEDWQLRVGSSALLVTGPGPTAVVDPWLAFDDPAAHERRLGALPVPAGDVELVINSHVDGVGANVTPDTGTPTFANARYLLPLAELHSVRSGELPGAEAYATLADAGVLEGVDGPQELAPGLALEMLPGHNAGHMGVRVGPAGSQAIIIGHLFLHPAQVANTANAQGERDVALLKKTREDLLARCVDDGTILIGPLFAAPGGGTVVRSAGAWALV